jgi:hypothetical protein
VHLGGMDFDVFQTGGAQLIGYPAGGFFDI